MDVNRCDEYGGLKTIKFLPSEMNLNDSAVIHLFHSILVTGGALEGRALNNH